MGVQLALIGLLVLDGIGSLGLPGRTTALLLQASPFDHRSRTPPRRSIPMRCNAGYLHRGCRGYPATRRVQDSRCCRQVVRPTGGRYQRLRDHLPLFASLAPSLHHPTVRDGVCTISPCIPVSTAAAVGQLAGSSGQRALHGGGEPIACDRAQRSLSLERCHHVPVPS